MNDKREQFEALFSDQGKFPKAVERLGEGYRFMAASSAWVTWCAALSTEGAAQGTRPAVMLPLQQREPLFIEDDGPPAAPAAQGGALSDDDVEKLSLQAGWSGNRCYMTPADYHIWCDRMRKFAALCAPAAQLVAQELALIDRFFEIVTEVKYSIGAGALSENAQHLRSIVEPYLDGILDEFRDALPHPPKES